MTMVRFEVGFVSATRALVDFLAEVFELEELPPIETPPGTLHRLQSPGALLKVMVPLEPPKSGERVEPFYASTGLRYLSIWVDDLDAAIVRACARDGKLLHGPIEFEPGMRIAVLLDPDGNPVEVVESTS
jgi:catechol 2,3-dioxygenase-like lactoylglutathione lyase family enzyme